MGEQPGEAVPTLPAGTGRAEGAYEVVVELDELAAGSFLLVVEPLPDAGSELLELLLELSEDDDEDEEEEVDELRLSVL